MRIIDPAGVPATSWQNGAGRTRELARWPEDSDHPDWRVSVADLHEPAAFSVFPGIDRLFVPLGPVRLTVGRFVTVLRGGEEVRFAGEQHAFVVPIAFTRALNVFTRRGLSRGCVVLQPTGSGPVRGTVVRVRLGDRVADIRFARTQEGQR